MLWRSFSNFAGFLFSNCRILKKKNVKNFLEIGFPILMFQKPSLGSFWGPTPNLDPIGSVVLTIIGYKQTKKQSIYIEET